MGSRSREPGAVPPRKSILATGDVERSLAQLQPAARYSARREFFEPATIAGHWRTSRRWLFPAGYRHPFRLEHGMATGERPLAISMGEPAGIGPDLIVQAAARRGRAS